MSLDQIQKRDENTCSFKSEKCNVDITFKTYVKLCYKSNSKSTKENPVIRVKDRNPEFLKDLDILKCQFFDLTEVNVNGEKIVGEKRDISPIIHFGNRIVVSELNNSESDLSWINKMIDGLNIKTIILYNNDSFIIPNENDITYDEYINTLDNNKVKVLEK